MCPNTGVKFMVFYFRLRSVTDGVFEVGSLNPVSAQCPRF